MVRVRPQGDFGPYGFFLPTTPQFESPGHVGRTHGGNEGATSVHTNGTTSEVPVLLPEVPRREDLGGLGEICKQAEAAGAGGLWAVDHLYWPRPLLECLTALTVAAMSTHRVPVGSCVLQLPLRKAVVVAKQAATLQLLSGNRLVLGLGLGSHPGEFHAAGADYTQRAQVLNAGIDALRHAWQEPDHPGARPREELPEETRYAQHPVPRSIPLWIGGSSTSARRRAARLGDGWVPLFLTPSEYRTALGVLREETERAGRDPATVVAAAVAFVSVGPAPAARERGARWLSSLYGLPPRAFGRHLICGPAKESRARVDEYREAGAEHVAIMVTDDHGVDQFAELVAAGDASRGRAPTRPVGSAARTGVPRHGVAAGDDPAHSEASVGEVPL